MNTNPKILIVEDDAVLVMNLQDKLSQMGYQIAGIAATGEAAVQLALSEQPEAILMDINLLGDMSGIQAAEQIHALQNIPIIYLSAYTDETYLQQAKITEAYAYLTKPVRERELRACLEMALYKHSAEQKLRHLNHVLRAVRYVNQLIIREHDPNRLVDEACKILLRTRGYRYVWIGQSAGDRLIPMSFAGEGIELLKKIISTATPEQGKRLPGTEAFNSRKVIICLDMLNDERYSPWRDEIEKVQFRSTVAVPILNEEVLFGVLIVYAERVNFFDEEEIDLLVELASDIAFGLKSIDEKNKKQEAEKALRHSESKFRAIVENSHDGIIMIDENRKLKYISPSYSRISGYAPEEWIGAYGPDLIHPEDREYTTEMFNQALHSAETIVKAEYRIRHKQGHWVWVETTATNLLNDPHVKSVALNSRDITERKQTREALLNSEQSARRAAERLQMVNQMGTSLTAGLEMEKLMQTMYEHCQRICATDTFYIALYNDDTDVLSFPFNYKDGERRIIPARKIHENAGLTGRIIEKRQTIYLPDTDELPAGLNIVRQPGTPSRSVVGIPLIINNRVVGVVSAQSNSPNAYTPEQIHTLELLATQVAIAIQNSQLYEQIQREKNLADALIDNLPGAFFLIDRKIRVIRWNKFAENELGYTKNEIRSMNALYLFDELDRERIAGLIPEAFSTGHVKTETQLISRRDDIKFPFYINSTRVQFGNEMYLLTIGVDISERKQREHELEAIATLSSALRVAHTRNEMLPVIAEQMVNLLNVDSVCIEVIDPLTGDAIVEAARGSWESLVGARQKRGTGLNAIISRTLKPYFTKDMENDFNTVYPSSARAGIRGATGMPLIAQEKLIGFLWIGRKTIIVEMENQLFSAIANITANAIHRVTLHDQTIKSANDLSLAYDTTLEGWARALELRDQETEGHSKRVVEMTLRLARYFGVAESELIHIRRGAILHDIGKMGVPDSILRKPGPLTDEEWLIMRKHPIYAYDLLSPIEHLHPSLAIPYCHHEKWDGSGYPRGLKEEQIPLSARMFAVVDVWDALCFDRPYRKAWTKEETAKYIYKQSGTHFDPKVVKAFLKLLVE